MCVGHARNELMHIPQPIHVSDVQKLLRVEPAAGSIVFYPGHYVHEVTPVACGPGDFAAARLSVVVTFVPEAA